MKKQKIKRIGFIVISLVIIITAFMFVDSLLPEPIEKSLEFWGITPKDNSEYMDEELSIHDKQFFVYTAVDSDGENDVYTITTGDIKGPKYEIVSNSEIEDIQLKVSEYSENLYISNYPEREIKKGSKYLGSIYVGIVPATCSSVLINGHEAKIVYQSFNLNGTDVAFNLYYCAIEDVYNANLLLTDHDGTKYSVTPIEKDGLFYPNIEIVK